VAVAAPGLMVKADRASRPRTFLASAQRKGLLVVLLLLALLFSLSGCRKKQPTPAELRAITLELVAAAQKATGRQAEITIRPELGPAREGSVVARDHIYITLADPGRLRALEDGLDQVARRHQLKRDSRSATPGVVRINYSSAGWTTHSIHIISPIERARMPATPRYPSAGAWLAIIIDDLGYDPAAADALFALPFPLTVSVLPNLPHSAEIAEEAQRRGYQVMMHLPMEPGPGESKPEPVELHPGMNQEEVARTLAAMLESVPGAVGVNNHQGSRATADAQLMAETMTALRDRGLFFIDSRTTTETVAYQEAERLGVPAAYRKVFLDDVPDRGAIRGELERAARLAQRQGWSIAIGHPHPTTMESLKESLPGLEARGIRLVFASQLAR
jgi:uncharacterized protein